MVLVGWLTAVLLGFPALMQEGVIQMAKGLARVSVLGAVSSRWAPLCGGIPYHHFLLITAASGIITSRSESPRTNQTTRSTPADKAVSPGLRIAGIDRATGGLALGLRICDRQRNLPACLDL